MKKLIIAVDGPSGAGKSSVSKIVAKKLGYVYIDSGAMYRSVALIAFEKNLDIASNLNLLDNIAIDFMPVLDGQRVVLNGRDVTEKIRTPEISILSSKVAKIREVREKLISMQRKLGNKGGVIMDGRDIGTVVFPNADVKIYLDASLAERAKRRHEELKQMGIYEEIEKILNDMQKRDEEDSKRDFSPLVIPDDAHLIDTTSKSKDEVVLEIMGYVSRRSERT